MTAQLTDTSPRTRTETARHTVATVVVVLTVGGWALADSFGPHVRAYTLPSFVVLGVWCVFVWICAPRVSYRRRDIVFVLIPPFGLIWLTAKIVYRLTLLPYRDWNPRPDETGWVQIRDPERPGRLLYLANGERHGVAGRLAFGLMSRALPPTPAGWYDDPYEREIQRYHSGSGWTDQTRVAEPVTRTATAMSPSGWELPPPSGPLDVAVRDRARTYWVVWFCANVGVAALSVALLPVIGVRALLLTKMAISLLVIVAGLRLGSALIKRHNAKFRP